MAGYKAKKRTTKKRFTNGAVTIHKKNKINRQYMRGGIRL